MNKQLTDDAICQIVGNAMPKSATRPIINPSTHLRSDLGLDSVGLMSLVMVLEEETGIDAFAYVEQFIGAENVGDIIDIVREAA